MKKLSKIFLVLAFMLFSVCISGCTSVNQLHERLIVQGIGIDKGENGNLQLTVHALNAESSQEKETNKTSVLHSSGKSVLEAFSNLTKSTGKEPLFSQNFMIVIGEECAKSGINDFMDFFIRYYEVRPAVSVFVSMTTADEILTCKYDDDFVTAKEIDNLSLSGNLTAAYRYSNIMDITNALMSDISDPVAMALKVEKDDMGNKPVAYGMALFSDDKLIGYANSEQSRAILLMSGEIKNATIVTDIDEEAGEATLMINDCHTDIGIDDKNITPQVNIKIDVKLSLYSLDKAKNKKLPNEYIEIIENKVSHYLQENCLSTVEDTIKKLNNDPINLGKRLRIKNPDFFRLIQNTWHSELKNIKFNIEVYSTIDKTGQEMSPL